MPDCDSPETIDAAVRDAVALGRLAASHVLNMGYVYDLVCNRTADSRLLTVVEDTDGRGPAYRHYFSANAVR